MRRGHASSELLEHEGVLGTILRGVLAYERGDWEELPHLGLDQDVVRDAYLHALAWAEGMRETLAQAASISGVAEADAVGEGLC